jgi:hypothetical protein
MNSKNFVIFFNEKEGTSPLVRLLHHVPGVAIVHQEGGAGWEPFDKHNCGTMRITDLIKCLEMIYSAEPVHMSKLNALYTKTASRPLASFEKEYAVGFKMRFRPAKNLFMGFPSVIRRLPMRTVEVFRRRMFRLLKEYDVTVFIAVRQDVLRWALSMYHGDGSAKKGHMQFKVARGVMELDDLPKLHVDCDRLSKLISEGTENLEQKKKLINNLQALGITAQPIFYEEFCFNPQAYLRNFFDRLGAPVPDAAIAEALQRGTVLKKVHPHDIATFVSNHEEVLSRFSGTFVPWTQPRSVDELPNAAHHYS